MKDSPPSTPTVDRTVAALTYVRFVLDANNSLTLPATAVYSVDDSGGWLRRDERMPLHRNAPSTPPRSSSTDEASERTPSPSRP